MSAALVLMITDGQDTQGRAEHLHQAGNASVWHGIVGRSSPIESAPCRYGAHLRNGDPPRPLRQILFQTADAITRSSQQSAYWPQLLASRRRFGIN
jgi:hypothetical protein